MARYYFDVQTDNGTTSDEEGVELDGTEAANREAMLLLADLARVELSWREGPIAQVEVRDNLHGPLLKAVLTLSIVRPS